jgi:heme b synthase|tara:strand:- start:5546 stop:6610 length:1065 start_codon:yes stop_codon:yes gene_type:complete
MKGQFSPRLIAFELTGSCNLQCKHCRASASKEMDPDELTTLEVKNVIDNIALFFKPILILTGGEPLLRDDIFEIVEHATKKGLRVVLGTNGTLLNNKVAEKLTKVGVKRVSISIDCAFAEDHDEFRGVEGAYNDSLKGISACKKAGLEFQINTTVTRHNFYDLKKINSQTKELGAAAHHIFLLVPTGRGKGIAEEEISPDKYESVLNWMYDVKDDGVNMKATCAPHFVRIFHKRSKADGIKLAHKKKGMHAMMGGCMGGTTFAFISRKGDVDPCGYLPLHAGNIREKPFNEIWESGNLFLNLRNRDELKGKCGACEYKIICGGCRARAYAKYNDYMDEEPYCVYTPPKLTGNES